MDESKSPITVQLPLYVLDVDGAGEYRMRREDGERCLLLFSTKAAADEFIARREMPTQESVSPVALETADSVRELLVAYRPSTRFVALDPPTDFELSTVFQIDDLLSGAFK
jgi:hypothetical protein